MNVACCDYSSGDNLNAIRVPDGCALLLIGISGGLGSGKTSLARNLRDHYNSVGYQASIASFGDPVKELAMRIFDPGGFDFTLKTPESKERRMSNGMTVRRLLQAFGTDFARELDSFVWIRHMVYKMLEYIEAYSRSHNYKGNIVIIDDVRFSNELEFLANCGAINIRMDRRVGDDKHISENDLAGDDMRFNIHVPADLPGVLSDMEYAINALNNQLYQTKFLECLAGSKIFRFPQQYDHLLK